MLEVTDVRKTVFFTKEMINNCIMSTQEEESAKLGYCPTCKIKSLKFYSRGEYINFHGCTCCKGIVILKEKQ